MESKDEIDRQGRRLLAYLATHPDDPGAARQFDALYYEIVWRDLRARHGVLGWRVARYLGKEGTLAPALLAGEVDEVAHDATATALRRVRRNAAKFDPAKSSASNWVIGNAEFAFVEVAKEVVRARRSELLKFVDPGDLLETEDPNQSTEEHVLRHIADADALEEAASYVSEREWVAIRLRITIGYSRGEAALAIFGDSTMKKQVDGLVERGLRKLERAWSSRGPSQATGESTKFSASADD